MFRRLLIACLLLLSCVSVKAADPIITNYPPTASQKETSTLTESQTTGDKKLILPQDENRLYLTLYGDPNDEQYVKLKKWFNENNELRAIRTQCHFSAIDTNSKLFQDRYADEVDKFPCIRFVTPGGVELLRIDGKKIPMSDRSLNNGVRTGLIKRLFGNDDQEEKQDRSPNQKFKDAINKKIDNDINLPPVAQAVFGPIIHLAVYALFIVVIGIVALVSVVGVIREARRS